VLLDNLLVSTNSTTAHVIMAPIPDPPSPPPPPPPSPPPPPPASSSRTPFKTLLKAALKAAAVTHTVTRLVEHVQVVLNPDASCSDTCSHPSDGDCDDGGTGSEYAYCDLGTDCTDCGAREIAVPDGACSETCGYASDGDCDDGGTGSEFSYCVVGTDCSDCGLRDVAPPPPPAPAPPPPVSHPPPFGNGEPICANDCSHSSDGDCDDGGDGSEFFICAAGSDCQDCGPRLAFPPPPPPNPPSPGSAVCLESCSHSSDGDCDDGGAGSEFDICPLGSDCTDCGDRPPANSAR